MNGIALNLFFSQARNCCFVLAFNLQWNLLFGPETNISWIPAFGKERLGQRQK